MSARTEMSQGAVWRPRVTAQLWCEPAGRSIPLCRKLWMCDCRLWIDEWSVCASDQSRTNAVVIVTACLWLFFVLCYSSDFAECVFLYRGENRLAGWEFRPVANVTNRCLLRMIVSTDIKVSRDFVVKMLSYFSVYLLTVNVVNIYNINYVIGNLL